MFERGGGPVPSVHGGREVTLLDLFHEDAAAHQGCDLGATGGDGDEGGKG